MSVITLTTLPDSPDNNVIYHLTPHNPDDAYYFERTDRNIGWISKEEQALLRTKTVGISGCGGMGGMIAQTLLRVGVGNIKIADTENFDVSNINRQFGATRQSVGTSKAFTTARTLRGITDDTSIWVYPRGINERDIDHFLEGCDIVLDEIEYWAVGARILLHQKARAKGITILNSNTIGFGTRLFLCTPDSMTIEECLELTYEEGKQFEEKVANGTVTKAERMRVMGAVILGLMPEVPAYSPESEPCGHPKAARKRLSEEGKAPIIGSNPPMASGFVSDHVILQLLKNSGIKRNIAAVPTLPGYLYFDAAFMKAQVRTPSTWRRFKHKLFLSALSKAAEREARKSS